MKKRLAKGISFICIAAALAIFAGACFAFTGFSSRLPRGVRVNGCDVGGLTFSCAEKVLRSEEEKRLKSKNLVIYAGEKKYEYNYPEIYYSDDFARSLRGIAAKGEYSFPVFYYLNGAEQIADYICADCGREKTEPYADFNLSGEPFTYHEGCDGALADKKKLLSDISQALNGGDGKARVRIKKIARSRDVGQIRENTRVLYSFTTYFDNSNFNRSSNIRLAAEKINGAIIGAGEVFSFNETVGPRTGENGFKEAKIIENGKFVTGTGGGVCQVSTTLYNAALLSGLEIREYHPHSIAVSYVSPSRDAMVSGSACDLRIANNRNTPIYMRVKCSGGSICCTIYGQSDGYAYSFVSSVTGSVQKPEEICVEGDEDKILSYGKEGIISEGYLVKSRGEEIETSLVRRDKYLPTADVRQIKRGTA